jgi:F-type H+-transporting ATPase subunit gamma
MPSTKELKQRIKGIKSTGKITRAMEMISAVKMRKALERVMMIRPYAIGSLDILTRVSSLIDIKEHPLCQTRPITRIVCVVITSHRGLCGSFNAQIMHILREAIRSWRGDAKKSIAIDFVSVGKVGDRLLRAFDGSIKASFSESLAIIEKNRMHPVALLLTEFFVSGEYDCVMLVSTDFVSALIQKPKISQLLPLSPEALLAEVLEEKEMQSYTTSRYISRISQTPVLFEPTPESVLDKLFPALLEMRLYHALLESDASQEAARMIAMHNATDASKDMVSDFTLSYNQLRQAKVTQEIAELSAGMAAVSG